MAERVGFEPTIRFPVYTLSKRAPSATRPPLRIRATRNIASVGGLTTRGTTRPPGCYQSEFVKKPSEDAMGRGILLWLIGIPLPIILVIWLLGGLHG